MYGEKVLSMTISLYLIRRSEIVTGKGEASSERDNNSNLGFQPNPTLEKEIELKDVYDLIFF